MEPVSLYDCGEEQGDNNVEEANAEDEEDNDYDEYLATYTWYSYDITQDQLEDDSEVCQVVKALEGGYHTVYNSKHSGSLYSYDSQRKSQFFHKNNSKSDGGMSAGGIATLIFFFIGAAVVVGAMVYKQSNECADPHSRAEPLVGSPYGIMT